MQPTAELTHSKLREHLEEAEKRFRWADNIAPYVRYDASGDAYLDSSDLDDWKRHIDWARTEVSAALKLLDATKEQSLHAAN